MENKTCMEHKWLNNEWKLIGDFVNFYSPSFDDDIVKFDE